MTANLLKPLRPTALAQLAAQLVIDYVDDLRDNTYEFNFRTEDAKNAYSDIMDALIDKVGDDRAFTLLDNSLAREWEIWNDKAFS